jgi:hypothetical protein
LQTVRRIVFVPVVLKEVENVLLVPLDGLPPVAVQDQEVTNPVTVGLQLNSCPQSASSTPSRPDVPGPTQPRRLISGAGG